MREIEKLNTQRVNTQQVNVGKVSRRTFMSYLAWCVPALSFLLFPRRARAEIDYFSGTDFVGKTRQGRYKNFYINYFKPMRRLNVNAWKLRVHGLCENPVSFSLEQLRALPSRSQVSRLKCVECWSAKAEWRGLHISELEKIVRPSTQAKGVTFRCADTYVEHLNRQTLDHERVLLAYNMDGEPLTHEHGFPLRVIAPFKYGYKNPKAILEVEYVAESQYGTWSKLGPYSTDGTILPGYDHPLDRGKKRRRIFGGEIFD